MLVDSSVWIEIFSSGKLANKCENRLKNRSLFIPSIVIFEVYKKIKLSFSEELALEIISNLSSYNIVNIDRNVALLAADLSIDLKLAMADAIVLACAKVCKLPLLTLDNNFASIPGVEVLR